MSERRCGPARRLAGLVLAVPVSVLLAQAPSGADVLRRVDENMFAHSRIVVSQMIIHGRRDTRTIEAKSWQRGTADAFTEYLAPAREQGTKMLKLGGDLWTYAPSTDRIIMISGSMLRQSVMGSDLSYEDMMEDPRLDRDYAATVSGTTAYITFSGTISWTSATIDADGCMIQNTNARLGGTSGTNTQGAGRAAYVGDFGGEQHVTGGTFTVVMPTADASNAILRLS